MIDRVLLVVGSALRRQSRKHEHRAVLVTEDLNSDVRCATIRLDTFTKCLDPIGRVQQPIDFA